MMKCDNYRKYWYGEISEEEFVGHRQICPECQEAFDLEPLSHWPFETSEGDTCAFRARELAWELGVDPTVRFLPCLGSFVGSDILAGVLATKMHES